MSYTGAINVQNQTGQTILSWSLSHQSGKFNKSVNSGRLMNGFQTGDFNFESVVGTVYDTWTMRFTFPDGPAQNNIPGVVVNITIKCLWGKDDDGGTGHLVLHPGYAELTTPKGNTCRSNY
jgi:hypothetical protein